MIFTRRMNAASMASSCKAVCSSTSAERHALVQSGAGLVKNIRPFLRFYCTNCMIFISKPSVRCLQRLVIVHALLHNFIETIQRLNIQSRSCDSNPRHMKGAVW